MYVRTLIIEGFMPYRDRFVLHFHKGQIIGITGQYGQDFARSNRAGKTSFIDAQVWCFYGKSRAKKDIELIHNDCSFAMVSAELYEDTTDEAVWITRSRDSDNKGVLEIKGSEGEKKAATQAMIDKIIGLNYEEFLFTAFFKQNDIDQFMEADPQKKKEIMMRWLQKIKWSEFAEPVNAFKLDLAREKDRLNTLLESLEDQTLDEQALLTETAGLTKRNTQLKALVEKFAKDKLDLSMQMKELKSVDEKKDKASELANKIQGLKNKRPDSEQQTKNLNILNEYLGKYPMITKAQNEENIEKRDRGVAAITQVNLEIKDYEKQIKEYGKDLTGICPILKQQCSRIEVDPDHLTSLKTAVEGLRKKLTRFEDARDKISKMIALYGKQVEWTGQKEKLVLQMQAAKALESQIADLSNQRAEIVKSIPHDVDAKILEISGKIDKLDEDQEACENTIRSNVKRLGEISQAIKEFKASKDRKASYEHQLKEIELQLSDAQWVEYMFGKNGIPSMELENSYHEIESDSNLILKNLKAPFHMEFEPTRELKDWEPNCLVCGTVFEKGERTHKCTGCGADREKKRKDELSLMVFENGIERQFYMDSGGGKILLSVAIRLALTMLARRKKGTTWGTIYLDELFGQLDATNRRLMSDLITTVFMGVLGFEQVFIISHDPNIQTSMADQLIVRRNPKAGYSELFM